MPSPSNYPPGVTGNEPEINGDDGWDTFYEATSQETALLGMSPEEALDAWKTGVGFWVTKQFGGGTLASLVEVVRAAINRGDWRVDSGCDPSKVLRRAEAVIGTVEPK